MSVAARGGQEERGPFSGAVRPLSRVKGHSALLRRLRGLLVAAHRFGRHRATSSAERHWAARLVDGLTATVVACDPGGLSASGPGTIAGARSAGRPARAQSPPVRSGADVVETSGAPSGIRPLASAATERGGASQQGQATGPGAAIPGRVKLERRDRTAHIATLIPLPVAHEGPTEPDPDCASTPVERVQPCAAPCAVRNA